MSLVRTSLPNLRGVKLSPKIKRLDRRIITDISLFCIFFFVIIIMFEFRYISDQKNQTEKVFDLLYDFFMFFRSPKICFLFIKKIIQTD